MGPGVCSRRFRPEEGFEGLRPERLQGNVFPGSMGFVEKDGVGLEAIIDRNTNDEKSDLGVELKKMSTVRIGSSRRTSPIRSCIPLHPQQSCLYRRYSFW